MKLVMVAAMLAACAGEEPTDRVLCNQQWPLGGGTVSVQYCARACQTPPAYVDCTPDTCTPCTFVDELGRDQRTLATFTDEASGVRGTCTFKMPADFSSAEIVFHACFEQ